MRARPYLVSLTPALLFAALFPLAEVLGLRWYAFPMELALSIGALVWALIVPRGWTMSVLFAITSGVFFMFAPRSTCGDTAKCAQHWMLASWYFLAVCAAFAAVGASLRLGIDMVRRRRARMAVQGR